jgi:uncharacterized protein YggE
VQCGGAALICLLLSGSLSAQTSGNISYGNNGGRARAEQNERAQRVISKEDLPPDNSMFVDADVLMNVKPDEYVAVFGIAQEGATVEEADAKMRVFVKQFTDELHALHIRDSDLYVDFITQPKIYGYEVTENVAREKLTGFEVKKNVSIHYADRDLLDKLIAAAAKAQIYDLIKVDYVVKDAAAIQNRLREEAAGIIQQKIVSYQKLLGVKTEPPVAIYAERPAIYYPSSMYDSYTAAESASLTRPPNLSRYTIEQTRKTTTFYFNALDGSGFDKVINPVVIEPMVQFTLYLKAKYEVVR